MPGVNVTELYLSLKEGQKDKALILRFAGEARSLPERAASRLDYDPALLANIELFN
jgi:hypothetical protein